VESNFVHTSFSDWTRAFAVVNYEQAVKPFIASRHPGRTKGDDVERIVADVP
jgi:hypothetical protein